MIPLDVNLDAERTAFWSRLGTVVSVVALDREEEPTAALVVFGQRGTQRWVPLKELEAVPS